MKMMSMVINNGGFSTRSSDLDGTEYNISSPYYLTKKWRELETIKRKQSPGLLVRQAMGKIDFDFMDFTLDEDCE